MHLYLITRGVKDHVAKFIEQLAGQHLPMKYRKPGDTALKDYYIEVAVRPIQFWEVVFPEEQKDIMLNSIFCDPSQPAVKGVGYQGKTQHRWHDKYVWAIRKMLGCGVEPIPEYSTSHYIPFFKDSIEMVGIGIKKDYWTTLSGAHVKEKCEGAFEGL